MKRRPSKARAPQPTAIPSQTSPLVPPAGPPMFQPEPPKHLTPQEDAETIEPFLVSGGFGWHPVIVGEGFEYDPRPAGVQLCAYQYFPRGQVGFLKELRCAPFLPPLYGTYSPPFLLSWWSFNPPPALTDEPLRPGPLNGVYETPFAWEGMGDVPNGQANQWFWHLRILQGNPVEDRVVPPFDPSDPSTWWLVPSIPVPLAGSAYESNGIPGRPPSSKWLPQRMQVIQRDKLSLHVFVPEDCTLALFTSWTQSPIQPAFVNGNPPVISASTPAPIYAILPSFGQMVGYAQPTDRPASRDNAKFGWGG